MISNNLLQDCITLFLGIIVEALPFILLGSIVSTFIHVFVKTETILRILPKNKLGLCASIGLVGMFFPVCECGNVPVARQMIRKKIPGFASISFLLGAPILNPIVIMTTIVAFPDNPEIWWGRILLGFLIATSMGYFFSFARTSEFITSSTAHPHCHHDHTNNSRWKHFIDHAASEFLTMGSVMVIGAGIASATQTFVPREIIFSIASTPLLSIIAMMGLAFIISICSTTDAFFALAYAHQFSPASLLAFLVFGPMIDMKGLLLMRTTYRTKTLVYLAILVAVLVLGMTYFLDTFWL